MPDSEQSPVVPVIPVVSVISADIPVTKPIKESIKEPLKKDRNYSFKDKNPDSFTHVGDFIIPSRRGSTYWAVLVVLYTHFNERVYADQLLNEGRDLLIEEERWDQFVKKSHTTGYRKGQRIRREVKDWRQRFLCNAKTLTRVGTGTNQYGLRLKERGHVLLFAYDEQDKGYFILKEIENAKIGI